MYQKLLILLAIVSLTACNNNKNNNKLEEKRKELDKLNKEHAALQDKINALEKELGNNGANGGKVELVGITEPQKGVFSHFLEVQGKVDSDQNVNISSRVPGTVIAVKVQRGDKVIKGQLLAHLDDQVVVNGLDEIKNQLALATTVYKKQKNLWDQKIGTEIQYLSAKNNKEALEKRLSTMQEQLEMYHIRAPFSGTVDEVNTRVGELAAPGLPMFRVVNFEKTKILAELSENYANKVKAGDEVVVKFPDIDKEITSKIKVISQYINPTNRTFTIEVALNPKDMMLRPNLIAIVKIKDYTNKNVIKLPLNVVQKDDKDSNYVFIAKKEGENWVARKKNITTGITYNGEIEVLNGIEPSDKVVTTAFQNLSDGQRITISNAQKETVNK